MMINFEHFYSVRINLTAHHTAELNVTTASQSAVFGLHDKVHAHFLPQSIVWTTGEESGRESGCLLEKRKKLAEPREVEEIVDKKGHTTSIIWKWFGYLQSHEAQIKAEKVPSQQHHREYENAGPR